MNVTFETRLRSALLRPLLADYLNGELDATGLDALEAATNALADGDAEAGAKALNSFCVELLEDREETDGLLNLYMAGELDLIGVVDGAFAWAESISALELEAL